MVGSSGQIETTLRLPPSPLLAIDLTPSSMNGKIETAIDRHGGAAVSVSKPIRRDFKLRYD